VQIEIGNCDLEERCIHIFFYALTRLLSLSLPLSFFLFPRASSFLHSWVRTTPVCARIFQTLEVIIFSSSLAVSGHGAYIAIAKFFHPQTLL
jgi:hypothetical protein